MTLLVTPTRINQLTAGGQYPHEDCGESCASSILTDFGRADPVRDIERFAQEHGDGPADGTGGAVYEVLFRLFGVPSQVHSAPQESWLLPALDHQHECMVAIWSNHAGYPLPHSGIGHWVLVYGFDGSKYYFMNPVNAQLDTCSASLLAASAQNYGLEITCVLPKDQGHSSQPTSVAGEITVSFSGTVSGKPSVYLRAAPGTESPIIGGFGYGAALYFQGWVYHEPGITDVLTGQPDARWFQVVGSGWIPSAQIAGNPPNSTPLPSTPPAPAPAPAPPPDAIVYGPFDGTVSGKPTVQVRHAPWGGILYEVPCGRALAFDGYTHAQPSVPDAITGNEDDRWFHISPQADPREGWVPSGLINGNPNF